MDIPPHKNLATVDTFTWYQQSVCLLLKIELVVHIHNGNITTHIHTYCSGILVTDDMLSPLPARLRPPTLSPPPVEKFCINS